MSGGALLFVLGALTVIAWATARARAVRFSRAPMTLAPPRYHGWYAALWVGLPSIGFFLLWQVIAPALGTSLVVAEYGPGLLPTDRTEVLAQARVLAAAGAPSSNPLARLYIAADARLAAIGAGAAILIALAALAHALHNVRPALAARARVELVTRALLVIAALVAVVVTLGIVAALLTQSLRFFGTVPVSDFLLGTRWSPQVIDPATPGAALGAVPLFWGTFLIGAVIAMLVAAPLGLLNAIHLAFYAAPSTRTWLKPALELLAGIPTVVYGYFAALTVAPAVRDLGVAIGIAGASSESALAAGLVLGMMLVPLVSSLCDDALTALPHDLRDASLALGATVAETVRRVLLPAALPGVASAMLLAVSRAVGETMIVVMAASGVAAISADPFDPTTTVTRQIVDLLTGETQFDSPKTLAAFALGLVLFLVTLALNVAALGIVRRHRAVYD